jgi:hypothetical protein
MNDGGRRRYRYVGPAEVRARVVGEPAGAVIDSAAALAAWAAANLDDRGEGATFVVDGEGRLRLAARRSEHVACAGGGEVLTAGELRLSADGRAVVAATNQSTGYCPEPSSFGALARALDAIGVARPRGWTAAFDFRRCERCGTLNVVKEGWLACAACDADLPATWNLDG